MSDMDIEMTTNWLMLKHPVTFTGISANAHKMAHPFALFQQCVDDNKPWWLDTHHYTPEAGKRAGVKAPPFNDWRDHVLLPALRVYRARIEGVPVEAISPVVYSFKKDGGIRSIVGFVFRTKALHDSTDQIRCGANFGAPRPLPIDKDVCMPSDEPDMQMGRLDQMYDIALEPLVLTEPIVSPGPAEPTAPAKRKKRKRVHKVSADGRVYLCSKCKAPKRGHVCPFA